MKFKDGKTFSAYVRSKLHSGYIILSLGLVSLQENVNAIYEYMRVFSTRRV